MKTIATLTFAALLVPPLHGQASRTGPEWTTTGMDAQHSRSVPGDPQITLKNMKQPGFTLLWKQKFPVGKQGREALSEPMLVNTFIGYKGFKALAVVGANNALFAVDYDLGVPYWEKHFDVPAGTPACAQGIAVAPGRLTPLVPPPVIGTGVHGGYRSAVSKTGEGIPLKEVSRVPAAATVSTPVPAPTSTQTAAPANAAAPNGPGIGGASGPGGVPADAGPVTGPVRTGPPPGTGLYKGSQPIFAISSDGVLHAVSQGSAKELQKPVPFVPAGSGLFSLIDINDTVYAATMPGCGAAPDSLFAIDVSGPDKVPASWHSTTGPILGAPSFAASGTVIVVTAHAILALEPKTLKVKYTLPESGTMHSPAVVLSQGGTEYAAVTASGNRILLKDTGNTHPAVSLPLGTPDYAPTTLTTWEDAAGARWLLAADEAHQSGSLQAFRLVRNKGTLSLEPAWTSKAMDAPGSPIVINGIVFTLSTGIYRGKAGAAETARRSHPATIHALDAATGQELWNSGRDITFYVDTSGLSFSPGQIYVGAADGTLYAFGFPVPRQ